MSSDSGRYPQKTIFLLRYQRLSFPSLSLLTTTTNSSLYCRPKCQPVLFVSYNLKRTDGITVSTNGGLNTKSPWYHGLDSSPINRRMIDDASEDACFPDAVTCSR